MRQRREKHAGPSVAGLRIIGGRFRGRRLAYHGKITTRPMKDRVREAVFSLIGPQAIKESLVIDLFAGTGALLLEALSRGAQQAWALECNYQTIETLTQNIGTLEVSNLVQIVAGDTLFNLKLLELPDSTPWLVFCSPPYALYTERREELLRELTCLWNKAPRGSTFVVEADERFDFQGLPGGTEWNRRSYPPAELAWLTK